MGNTIMVISGAVAIVTLVTTVASLVAQRHVARLRQPEPDSRQAVEVELQQTAERLEELVAQLTAKVPKAGTIERETIRQGAGSRG